jgi:hypothetical protein
MRFAVEVGWGETGVLVGEVTAEGSIEAVPFWGVAELVGALEAPLGPPPGRSGEGPAREEAQR